MDWSSISYGSINIFFKIKYNIGSLASGSNDSKIYTYAPKDALGSDFIREPKPYTYHTDSVEDI